MDYEWATALGNPLLQLTQRMGEYLPNFLGATALLLVGWVLGRLLRAWSIRLLGGPHWLVQSPAIRARLKRIGVERPVAEVIGRIVFWVVFLFFLTAATETLGLPVLATWLSGVSRYLPRVLVAVLLVLAGLLAGNLARDAITTPAAAAGVVYGQLLGRVAQVIILLIAVVTGVDQIGIDSKFLTLTIVIGAITGGTALAFGLGARISVSNIIASHYLRPTYRFGHTVRISDVHLDIQIG